MAGVPLATTPPVSPLTTPYDGKIAIWFVHSSMVGETTIDELVATLRRYAPAVTAIFVKVTDGTDWIGTFDSPSDPKPDLAINGPADIRRWVSKLARYNLEFHAWALPKGVDPDTEASMMLQVCQQPGVRSLILDVEAGTGFFRGGRAAIRPLMSKLRAGLPGSFHIGLSVDPRPNHYAEIFPDEWYPFINSVHPQTYWGAFSQTPDQALRDTYSTWGNYKRPLIPTLQAYDVTADSMNRARNLAVKTYKAAAVSWYTFGAAGPKQYPAINVTLAGSTVPPPVDPSPPPKFNGRYGTEIVVTPDNPAYRDGVFNNLPSPFQTFKDPVGGTVKFVATNPTGSTVWARWDPRLPAGGYWEISAFVPAQHGTTSNARYKINGVVGVTGDVTAAIPQLKADDIWVSLGVYNLLPNNPIAGVVFLNDLTGESKLEVAFSGIRWRQIIGVPAPPDYFADGYDAPLGAAADRKLAKLWPPIWYTTNGFENYYYLGPGQTNPALHTGDDLILYDPATNTQQDAAHQPIYAAASGTVIYAEVVPNSTWGNLIVIKHDPLIMNGQIYYTRYGHVENMQVKNGDRVARGQHIANVGNSFGRFVYHLHFDVSNTDMLLSRPWDWPGLNKQRLEANYIDPYPFVGNNRPAKP